jgi:hypothetical protein
LLDPSFYSKTSHDPINPTPVKRFRTVKRGIADKAMTGNNCQVGRKGLFETARAWKAAGKKQEDDANANTEGA